jgi:curved DNA-binding protein CbpA
MNFYAVLGISRDADDEAIRSAYRILARRYHPDRGAGSSAEKFRQVNEAYETLIDPGTRQSYDLSLQWAQPQVPIRVEPMVAQSGLFPQEDAGLFGRFAAPPPSSVFRASPGFDELFDRWFHSLDDLFFDSEWPW